MDTWFPRHGYTISYWAARRRMQGSLRRTIELGEEIDGAGGGGVRAKRGGYRRTPANGSIKFMGALRWFQTLGWLAPSIRDAWHGSHAPRQLFHPSTETSTFFLPRRPLALFLRSLLVDVAVAVEASVVTHPPFSHFPFPNYRVLMLADATNLSAPGLTCIAPAIVKIIR